MNQDSIQRFIFDNSDVRGEIVRLNKSYLDALDKHNYPAPVKKLLGEFMVAATLLSSTLKFDGMLSLLCRSEGQIPLITAEANNRGELRAIAKEADNANSEDFKTLLKNGRLVITIEPDVGQRYQGIVHLDGNNLAECLQYYFQQSEQLNTVFMLDNNHDNSIGLMLQELPKSGVQTAEERATFWEHVSYLTATTTPEELLSLDNETLFYRLFHEEQLRLFPSKKLQFNCSCSRERTANAIRAIGQTEALSILAEQGGIQITCEFCHHEYIFNDSDVKTLFDIPTH